MKKAADFICRCITIVGSIMLVLMIILMMIVVIGRYCFSVVPAWSEELALFFMSWLGFLSAAVVERDKGHIRISIIDTVYPQWLLKICGILRYLLKLGFSVALTWYGFILATTAKGFYSSVNIPKRISFYPGCIAGVLITIFLLLRFKEEIIDPLKNDQEGASKI